MPDAITAAALREGAVARADAYYLDDDHPYGCAETVFITLKGVFGLDAPGDASTAMAFNGGITYGGGPCGAITGAAMAVSVLAEARVDDDRRAKIVARELVYGAMEPFREAHGVVDCRELIDYRLRAPGGHEAFLESGLLREACMSQIRTVVKSLAELADPEAWESAVVAIEATQED